MLTTTPSPSPFTPGSQPARRTGFLRTLKVRCRRGHTIETNARLREDGLLRCTHKATKHDAECGETVYILVLPMLGGRRRLWAADVTPKDMREMEAQHLDVDGVLHYLGAMFPDER